MILDRFRRVPALLLVLSLVVAIAAPLPARAQDDGITLVADQPLILTLSPGQTATRVFDIQAGDGFELRLDRLTDFAFTAVLIDPNQSAVPLTPGADGNIVHAADAAAPGGRYTLVLQAGAAAGGDLLIQLAGGGAPPVPLALGETGVTVEAAAQRFSLDPVPDVLFTSLSVETVVPEGVPGIGLPALSLVDETSGETILDFAPSVLVLPAVAAMLPAGGSFVLAIEPGEDTLDVLITWDAIPVESTPVPPAQPPASGSSGAPPVASGTCVVAFAGNVNVRYGPGLAYQPPIGVAQAGTTLPVTGKNQDGSWWQVLYNGGPGWVSSQVAATSTQGDCSGVTVASFPAVGDTSALTPSASGSVTPTYTPGGPTVTPTYTPSPTYTPGGPTVTPTWTYTPSYTPSVTYTYTPTYTPSPTYTPGGPTLTPTWTYTPSYTPTATWTYTPSYTPTATWTYTPSYTPTQPQQQQFQQPSATYTPSYTPTTPPPPPTAPPDANFNAPLNIPLDSTTSVTDFVSYPGGDTEDRVRWDISGMNPNAALSGGRARLIIAVSCFGTGTQNIQFFTGGQTFSCGQTIVDREVTADSRTGQVTISAVAGENTYVQWVLTGTATRVS